MKTASKRHYTCQASVRGTASAGCHKRIEACAYDYKTLKKAGWAHDGNFNADRWKCPACKPPKLRKLTPIEKQLRRVRYERGRSDAVLGLERVVDHPAYNQGYKEGKALLDKER
jgi:hypothetical protein